VADGHLFATTSTEVVQELLYVLDRRGRGADGIRLSRRVLLLFPELLPVSPQDIGVACDLLERYTDLSVRDSVHAAVMINNGIVTMISADRHFDSIEEIKRIDPGDASGKI